MKVIFEGEISSVSSQYDAGTGERIYKASASWITSKYSSDSITVPGRWELGQKVRITVETLDHEDQTDAQPEVQER